MVIKRETIALDKILDNYRDKKILIVGHSTAFSALFTKWCDVKSNGECIFNNKMFFDGKWNYCETFKLEFDDYKKLISINNIK